MKLYFFECDVSDTGYRCMYELVSDKRQKRADKFVRRKDAICCISAELLIRYAFAKKYGMNQKYTFQYNAYGKPYMVNKDDFYFNLSHSGIWTVCAVSDNHIGVDIQKMNLSFNPELAKQYFFYDEIQDILISDDQLSRFYYYWTAKESYIKCVGKGLSIPLDSFIIKNNKVLLNNEYTGHMLFSLKHRSDYILAACTESDIGQITQEFVDIDSLLASIYS